MSNFTNQTLYQMMFGPGGTYANGAAGSQTGGPQPSSPASWMSGSALGMPGTTSQSTGSFGAGTTANGNALANYMPKIPGPPPIPGFPSSTGQSQYGQGQQGRNQQTLYSLMTGSGAPQTPNQPQGNMGRQTMYGMMGGGQQGGSKGAASTTPGAAPITGLAGL